MYQTCGGQAYFGRNTASSPTKGPSTNAEALSEISWHGRRRNNGD